jgi:hypothetical protein
MQSDPRAEWERLTHLYAEKSDEELVDLAEDFGNLTDVAQQVLRDEMRKRRLEGPGERRDREQPVIFGRWGAEPESDAAKGEAEPEPGNDDEPVEYTWKTLLCECDDNDQAELLGMALKQAGIENWVEHPDAGTIGRLLPRVLVPADELDKAREVASRPIPQEIVDLANTPAEEFVAPSCPKCGSANSLLVSLEPTNAWRCDDCGARWSDALPVENEGQNPA